ncbi:MAG: Di-trans,poly-cis-decaprenylcistransferase, partial [uncultured bacterium]
VKFRLLGRMEELAPEIIRQANISTELMKDNPGLSLNLCINYGGRAEIVDAVKKIIKAGYQPEDISEELISRHLYWPELPDVDLMVRTSGEMRTSNFHLWRGAYAELYFTPVLWPDFDDVELLRAIAAYQNRERRFGKISEQL